MRRSPKSSAPGGRNASTTPRFCASRAGCSRSRAIFKVPNGTISPRSTGRAASRRKCGSCVPRPAWHGCGRAKASARTRMSCSPRFTAGSLKVLTRRICWTRRRFSPNWDSEASSEVGGTAVDVASWLRSLGLERYQAIFRENDVDAELLPKLTADSLRELGITSFGHRHRLLEAIAALRPEGIPADEPVRSSTTLIENLGSSESTAERRPLSVMFCDLIGSTALSSRLDAEDLREIIRTYQACVAATIRQFDGFIARYVGDGVLIYFGWPEARETDAERAVRAGLAVAATVSATPIGGEPLHVRIGIATGLVIGGEPIGSGESRQQVAIGEAPNLAARLQGLAGPDQVVIDAATRRQIGGLFECQDLGTVELKGLTAAVPAWHVLSENRALGQFEALRSGTTKL